jgi:hypothetical protein
MGLLSSELQFGHDGHHGHFNDWAIIAQGERLSMELLEKVGALGA